MVIVGAMVGLIVGSQFGGGALLIGLLVGVFAGYTLAELTALRSRNRHLGTEVDLLKERLSALWRRLAELERGVLAPGQEAGRGEAKQKPVVSAREEAMPKPALSDFAATLEVRDGAAADPTSAPARERDSRESSGIREAARGAPSTLTSAYDSSGASDGSLFDIPLFRVLRDYFTGGNTLVRVGVLILFFGVAFLLRYLAEHSHVPIQYRLSTVACGGLVLLVLGWKLRTRRLGYALAIQGGGVGILYLTTYAALRLYSLLPPSVAFGLLVAIAAFSAVLAVLQDSQAFACLAVTGGFLAPILASSGEGSHIVLFSYYAILNASILAIAWYKTWRPLNVLGFAFTFVISTGWGVLHYDDRLFASTEPFLVLFFAFYVAIAILFSRRQLPQLLGYVDGPLVFGTPMATFGYQAAMLHDRHEVLALSAVVLGATYLLLAWILQRQKRESQRLLVEAFMALGVVFFTVAAPLGLDSQQSGATWALEAAGIVWVGARQDRMLARVFGVLLQLAAGLVLFSHMWQSDLGVPSWGAFLARALVAGAAVLSAVILRKHADRLRGIEDLSIPVLFFFGLATWMVDGLHQIDRGVVAVYVRSAQLAFIGCSALVCSELSRRTVLTLARLPALWLLPVSILFAVVESVSGVRHPFEAGGWLAWAFDLACLYLILRRHESPAEERSASWLHPCAGWLVLGLLTWELVWTVDRGMPGRGSWAADSWMLIPALALAVLPRLVAGIGWPFRAHRFAYVTLFAGGLCVYLALWALVTNFTLPGDPYPFPYVPLLNALDLAQLLVLLVLARFWVQLRALHYVADSDAATGAAVTLGGMGFVWLNAALCRTLHRWAGVPLEFDALMQSTLVQTALSIFWTVLALATMLFATRRASRSVWLTGATLLAVTIVKLFVVDLSRVGTVERIVSFVGVGVLTLVIGYFSPLPPAAREHRTT